MFFAETIKAFRSIRLTLAIWYTGTLLVLALSMDTFLYYRLQRELTKQYDRLLRTYSADLGANLLEHLPDGPETAEAMVAELSYYKPYRVEYRAVDEAGDPLFSSDGWGDLPISAATSFAPNVYRTLSLPTGREPFRALSASLKLPSGQIGTETAISLRYVNKTLENYRRNMLLFTAPLLLVGAVGGFFLARKALSPVASMTATARQISSRDLNRRLPLRGTGDELDSLAGALNDMLDRLEEAFKRIERFSTELAHELRTPITRLVGETEAALVAERSEQELRDLLGRHAEQYASMRRMTNDILQLLRSGTDLDAEGEARVSLATLLDEVVESFRALAEEKGVVLSYAAASDRAEIICRPAGIRRLVSNLLDNAIRHTDTNGTVDLTVRPQNSSVEICVADSGEGIAEEEIGRVFERFFRGQRARADGGMGYGLGLSIVKQIVEQHAGTIGIESSPGKGTRVKVLLPVRPLGEGTGAAS